MKNEEYLGSTTKGSAVPPELCGYISGTNCGSTMRGSAVPPELYRYISGTNCGPTPKGSAVPPEPVQIVLGGCAVVVEPFLVRIQTDP